MTKTVAPKCVTACLALLISIPLTTNAGTVFDNFNDPHDYVANGTLGTIWHGVLNPNSLTAGDSSISQTGALTWSVVPNVGWEHTQANGPVLYRNVVGDFDASVSIVGMSTQFFSDGGLLVRVPVLTDAGPGEDYVALRYFFSINSVRSTDGGSTQNFDYSPVHPHLRITRAGSQLAFYSRAAVTDPWLLRQQLNRSDIAPISELQVGLWFGTFSPNSGFARFDNFQLSGPAVPEPSSLALALCGAAGLLVTALRRRRAALIVRGARCQGRSA